MVLNTPPAAWLRRSALLTIDVQADFHAPGAPALIDGTAERIPAMRGVARAYRAAGLPIVHAVRLYLPDGSNAEPVRQELVRTRSVVRPGTQGSQPARELLPDDAPPLDPDVLLAGGMQRAGESEWLMYKPRWGAFCRTGLEEPLRRLDAETVAFVGCNFPNCPASRGRTDLPVRRAPAA